MSSRANRAVKKSVSPRMNKLNRGLTSVGVNHTNHTSNRNYSKQKKIRRRNVPPPPQLLLCKHKFESQKPTQMSFAKGDVIQLIEATGNWHRGILRNSHRYPITQQILKYPPNFVQARRAIDYSDDDSDDSADDHMADRVHMSEQGSEHESHQHQHVISSSSSRKESRSHVRVLSPRAQAATVATVTNMSNWTGTSIHQVSGAMGTSSRNTSDSDSVLRTNESNINDNKQKSSSSSRVFVITKHKFIARSPKELSFAKGDIIEVIRGEGTKWHQGRLIKSQLDPVKYPCAKNHQILLYPSTYVTPVVHKPSGSTELKLSGGQKSHVHKDSDPSLVTKSNFRDNISRPKLASKSSTRSNRLRAVTVRMVTGSNNPNNPNSPSSRNIRSSNDRESSRGGSGRRERVRDRNNQSTNLAKSA